MAHKTTKYNFQVQSFIYDFLPPPHRSHAPLVQLLESLLQPLQEVNEELDDFVHDEEIRARANGQFIVMRAALIALTGISGITVQQLAAVGGQPYYFLESEGSSQLFYLVSEATPNFNKLSTESNLASAVFNVGVPAASYTAEVEQRIRAEVARFGLPFTDFTVTPI